MENSGLAESDNFSCIKKVTQTVHISLPSLYISNEITGVTDIFESWKRQYVPQLNGVVVSYKNVSLTSNAGLIVIDKPFVHYDVRATFELFCPNIGSIVKGRINRISLDYVGCLVHDTINVAIKRHDNAPSELSHYLVLDRMILFKITCFDFHRRVIRVKGDITKECIRLMKEIPSFHVPINKVINSRSTYYSSDTNDNDDASNDKTKNSNENDSSDSDKDDQSPSLLAPNFSVRNKGPVVFNCDHLADGHGLSSYDSDSRQSNISSLVEGSNKINVEEAEPMDIDKTLDSAPKKKKKHKDKKSSKKSSKKDDSLSHPSDSLNKKKKIKTEPLSDNSSLTSPKKKKTSKKSKKGSLKNPNLKGVNGPVVGFNSGLNLPIKEEITTDSSPSKSIAPKKKKTSKKSKKDSLKNPNLKGVNGPVVGFNSELSLPIKKEIPTDSSPSKSLAQKKKKSKNLKNPEKLEMKLENHITPHVEDIFASIIVKTELQDSKKRKHKSGDKGGKPLKKRKKNDEQQETVRIDKIPDKTSKKVKSKKTDKSSKKVKSKKTDKSSKKDKKKKSSDKKLKTKKDKLDHKMKPKTVKKSKKSKPKKLKVEVKEEPNI